MTTYERILCFAGTVYLMELLFRFIERPRKEGGA